MNILLLSSAYNTLTQHAHVELKARQHRVGVAVVGSADDMAEAVEAFQPDLILCPMLTRIIPSSNRRAIRISWKRGAMPEAPGDGASCALCRRPPLI